MLIPLYFIYICKNIKWVPNFRVVPNCLEGTDTNSDMMTLKSQLLNSKGFK